MNLFFFHIYPPDLKLLLTQNNLNEFSAIRVESIDTHTLTVVLYYQKQKCHVHLVQLIAMVLAKVKQNAERFLQSQVNQCIITVPSCYSTTQRFAMQNAAMIAGFNVVQIVNDTSAAAITYAAEKNVIQRDHLILIFDVGATSTKASIVRIDGQSIIVKASFGKMTLGGDNFVMRLVRYFTDDFFKKTNINLVEDDTALARLRASCEELKKRLFLVDTVKVTLELFYNGNPWDLELTRSVFESLCEDLFTGMINVLTEVVDQTAVEKSEIERVILVGGGSRLSKLQQDLVTFMDGKEPSRILNQDEAIATGAAYYSSGYFQIKEVNGNGKSFANESNPYVDIEQMQQFLKKVEDDDKALVEYQSELNNLEALCYCYKRELKKRDLVNSEQEFIANYCKETLLWIKNANRNHIALDAVKLKIKQLTEINLKGCPPKIEKEEYNGYEQPRNPSPLHETAKEEFKLPDLYDNDSKIVRAPTNKVIEGGSVSQEKFNELRVVQVPDQQMYDIEQPKDTTTIERITQKDSKYYHIKLYNRAVDAYKKKSYEKAAEIFTKLLNSTGASMYFKVTSLYAYRGVCYYHMQKYQLCLDNFKNAPKTAELEEMSDDAENKLFQIKFREKSLDLSILSQALNKQPANPTLDTIQLICQLYCQRALYNISLKNYDDVINDIYQIMFRIHKNNHLVEQRDEMYEVLKLALKASRLMKYKSDVEATRTQFKYIEKCFKETNQKSFWNCVVL